MVQCDLEKETAEMMIQCMIGEDIVNVDSHTEIRSMLKDEG